MDVRKFVVVVLICLAARGLAQQSQSAAAGQSTESVVVVGTAQPVALGESASAVRLLPLAADAVLLATPLEPLRSDASVFLEQRGAGGAQTDITLRGGSFAQTLVLLNGFRINDSQTAHHNLDLPVPLAAMDSIQVLHGAGSTLHGADALSGVVDFLTAAPRATAAEASAGFGSFGESEQAVTAEVSRPGGKGRGWSDRITGSHNLSSGFTVDRDYRNQTGSNESWFSSRAGLSDVLVAGSDRSFGAANFYGNYPSWERTKGWFAGIRQEIGSRSVASFGYRRHTDEFVLLRDQPAVYENNHVDASWQASLRHTIALGSGSVMLAGVEADGDSIESNNLGRHGRNRTAGYVDVDLHPGKSRWSLAAGLREEGFSGGEVATSPHLAGSVRVTDSLKLRASAGYGYRIPTYTDLYYSDPTTIGNAHLKPESAWSGDGGLDWNAGGHVLLSATGFYSRQRDAIDYVRATSAQPWQAANLSGLHFGGVELSAEWAASRTQTVRVAWTSMSGAQDALHGLQSEYVFNYPSENAHVEWRSAVGRWFTMRNSLQVVQRYQRAAYPVWDLGLTRTSLHAEARIQPYLRLTNLSNTGYQEIAGVAMPGRAFTGGVTVRLGN